MRKSKVFFLQTPWWVLCVTIGVNSKKKNTEICCVIVFIYEFHDATGLGKKKLPFCLRIIINDPESGAETTRGSPGSPVHNRGAAQSCTRTDNSSICIPGGFTPIITVSTGQQRTFTLFFLEKRSFFTLKCAILSHFDKRARVSISFCLSSPFWRKNTTIEECSFYTCAFLRIHTTLFFFFFVFAIHLSPFFSINTWSVCTWIFHQQGGWAFRVYTSFHNKK